ncbi:MAG TPA: efflux RND transporter periplasmic adaptor subunit [Steroidobacteraceae bacterium]|nr:efflux RND transporter periplasmic adaptor subunit [Steroidobacteraceae bacterium]
MSSGPDHSAPRGATPGKSIIAPLLIMVLLVALVVGGVFAWQAVVASFTRKFMAQAAAAPQTVSTVTAEPSLWQEQIHAIGTLRAVRGADLSAQAAGVVDDIEFHSGQDVAAGKLLVRLRPNDDFAKLDELKAAAQLADETLRRDREQFAAQAISQATIDTDVSTLKSARAQVAAQHALIEEKLVRAPFAGRLGIRQVDPGQYLAAGTTIVTLQALDPILVDFYVPQQTLQAMKLGDAVSVAVDTYPGASFPGVIDSINSKVDSASRNVQVRASLRNADRRLLPGMFASVAIDAGAAMRRITLPQAAITYNPYGNTVYVVEHGKSAGGKAEDSVQQRFIKLGATRGDQVAVLSGVQAGEVVVSAGQLKLRNGSTIVINNSVQPMDDAHPTPPNE